MLMEWNYKFAADFKNLWVLRKNGKVQALFSFEPSVERMSRALRMASDAVTMQIFQSRTSGIDCGWESVQSDWSDWPVITQ